MTVTTAPNRPAVSILNEVAQTFIEIHLDDLAKRDLAVWFVEHPEGQYQVTELGRVLGHDRAAIKTGLRCLREALVIAPAGAEAHSTWRLTPDPATRQILRAVARYFREHPGARTIVVRRASP
jgi:hypothetical protein